MPITVITGVPGTGKTALLVSMIEEAVNQGRTVFVNNIPGLLLPHYRCSRIEEWQKGTWLHIDIYKRPVNYGASLPVPLEGALIELDESESDGNENWQPHPDVHQLEDGSYIKAMRDQDGNLFKHPNGEVCVQPYESHKGAIVIIDEAQRIFRPRPNGSAVPDHVAALEVHRHQGLDFWLITQRVGLIDSNVRGLCGKHIALRSTALGRYKYEWPECGDVDSKTSRDVAAKSRFQLPKHVFKLYKSAEVHTVHKHKFPFLIKAALCVIPVGLFFAYSAYSSIQQKVKPAAAQASTSLLQSKAQAPPVSLPAGFEPIPKNLLDDVPVVKDRPETAPMYAPLRQVVAVPYADACMHMGEQCRCYTASGSRIPSISYERCLQILDEGKVFDARRSSENQQVAMQQPMSVPQYTSAAPVVLNPLQSP